MRDFLDLLSVLLGGLGVIWGFCFLIVLVAGMSENGKKQVCDGRHSRLTSTFIVPACWLNGEWGE